MLDRLADEDKSLSESFSDCSRRLEMLLTSSDSYVSSAGVAESCAEMFNRYKHKIDRFGRIQDHEDAIALERSALARWPKGHPHRSSALKNLAESLYLRFREEGHVNDFNESIQLRYHTTGHLFSSFSHRLKAVRRWTTIVHSYDHPTLLEAHKTSTLLLQFALSTRPTRSTRHQFLSRDGRIQSLALDAASCAIAKGNLTRAIEFLEQGKTLLSSQMRGLRNPLEQLS